MEYRPERRQSGDNMVGDGRVTVSTRTTESLQEDRDRIEHQGARARARSPVQGAFGGNPQEQGHRVEGQVRERRRSTTEVGRTLDDWLLGDNQKWVVGVSSRERT